MPFIKVIKNKAYFKRFQVKNRRRREGKTDFAARKQMILQDKTKYNAPKFRLVVRVTNRDIVAQIVQAKIVGDDVVSAAYSHELPRYGVKFGLTNYAAGYCTGLLIARRVLDKLKIADKFPGAKEATGAFVASKLKNSDEDDKKGPYPMKAILDVGLARTTTGSRVFAVLKGAVDGGLAIPHNPKRFFGYDRKKDQADEKKLRGRIFGQHVADYMKKVAAKNAANPDAKLNQFKAAFKDSLKPESLEAIYKKAHADIRAKPQPAAKKVSSQTKEQWKAKFCAKRKARLTLKERKTATKKRVEKLRNEIKKALKK